MRPEDAPGGIREDIRNEITSKFFVGPSSGDMAGEDGYAARNLSDSIRLRAIAFYVLSTSFLFFFFFFL